MLQDNKIILSTYKRKQMLGQNSISSKYIYIILYIYIYIIKMNKDFFNETAWEVLTYIFQDEVK